MPSLKQKQEGFSLIEVLVSIFIVAIGILAIIQLFPLGMNINSSSERLSVASSLAQTKIEELLSESYNDLPVGTAEARHFLSAPYSIYERQTTINYLGANLAPSSTDQGLKKIVVTVYYPSILQSESSQSFVLTTLVSIR